MSLTSDRSSTSLLPREILSYRVCILASFRHAMPQMYAFRVSTFWSPSMSFKRLSLSLPRQLVGFDLADTRLRRKGPDVFSGSLLLCLLNPLLLLLQHLSCVITLFHLLPPHVLVPPVHQLVLLHLSTSLRRIASAPTDSAILHTSSFWYGSTLESLRALLASAARQ